MKSTPHPPANTLAHSSRGAGLDDEIQVSTTLLCISNSGGIPAAVRQERAQKGLGMYALRANYAGAEAANQLGILR